MPSWLVGLLQVLVPALIVYLEQIGILPTGNVASIAAVGAAAAHSAFTTQVSPSSPPTSPK